ncbi:MAG: FG-GAP-like repeat-containing protein [Verrucomicrobiota bacterium]
MTPTLGNYPPTSIALSADTTVMPDAAPTNATRISVSTSTNFKGKLEGYPTTGVVRATDAHPAGTYTVTVKAFDSGGATATKTFMLTVTTPVTCTPVNFAAAVNLSTGFTPVSVVVGDFNGDGMQDLAVANYDSTNVSILLGDGAGHFSAATNFGLGAYSPSSLAVGDFNGDGKQDLAIANNGFPLNAGRASILLGDGAGNFSGQTNFAVGAVPLEVAVGDFNGDGKQDLAVANQGSDNVSILLGDGTGNFSAPTNFPVGTSNTPSVGVGDFNRDAKQDLAAVDWGTRGVWIFLRNCSVTPTPLSAVSRKAHGGAGSFDINLPFTGTEGIECRRGGGASFDQHQVIVTFDGPVTSVGGVMVTSLESGGSGSATTTVSGNTVTVNLTGITDQHNYVITLTSVNGNASNISIPIGILRGDTNGNAAVNAADIGQTKAQSGQAVTAANFREDVNNDGSIGAADVSLVKSNSGATLP